MRRVCTLVVMLVVVLLVCVGAYSQPGAPPELLGLHLNALEHKDDCVLCHGERTDEVVAGFKSPHTAHLTSPLLKMTCVTCHESVDMEEGSAALLRKQVNPELCVRCHGQFPDHGRITKARTTSCVLCHGTQIANRQLNYAVRMKELGADAYVNMEAVNGDNCLTCHGDKAWFAVSSGELAEEPESGAAGQPQQPLPEWEEPAHG